MKEADVVLTLDELALNCNDRSALLTRGFSSFEIALDAARNYFDCSGDDLKEIEFIDVEASKQAVSKGRYISEYWTRAHAYTRKIYAETGSDDNAFLLGYQNHVEHLRRYHRADFMERFGKVRTLVEQEKLAEFSRKKLEPLEMVYPGPHQKRLLKARILDYLTSVAKSQGLTVDRAMSSREYLVFSKDIGCCKVGLILDKVTLLENIKEDGSITGSLSLNFLIFPCDISPEEFSKKKGKYSYYPGMFFPLGRLPFGSVYEDFKSLTAMAVNIHAHLEMFEIFERAAVNSWQCRECKDF